MKNIRRRLVFGPTQIKLIYRIDPKAFDLTEGNLPAASIQQKYKNITVSPIFINPNV
jgi:hypothetical protein